MCVCVWGLFILFGDWGVIIGGGGGGGGGGCKSGYDKLVELGIYLKWSDTFGSLSFVKTLDTKDVTDRNIKKKTYYNVFWLSIRCSQLAFSTNMVCSYIMVGSSIHKSARFKARIAGESRKLFYLSSSWMITMLFFFVLALKRFCPKYQMPPSILYFVCLLKTVMELVMGFVSIYTLLCLFVENRYGISNGLCVDLVLQQVITIRGFPILSCEI